MKYTIQRGDTLSSLAKRYKSSVDELAKRNGIKNINRIYAGATLELPEVQSAGITRTESAAGKKPDWGARADYGAPFGEDATLAIAKQMQSIKPAREYKSAYSDKLETLMNAIEEREPFSYDYSEDPLYDNYKESYIQGGKLAMQDSMGSAAALTGGYGSSYAQGVGQQSYQAYMRALADKVPDLAEGAYDKYKSEEDSLYKELAAYSELDEAGYGRYRDEIEDANAEREFYYRQYRDEREAALARYEAEQEAARYERELAYKEAQNAREQENWEREYALKKSSSASKGASSSKSSKSVSSGNEAGEKIYSLFAGMTERERRVMLNDAPSIAYIKSVLGESGYAGLKRKYGVD